MDIEAPAAAFQRPSRAPHRLQRFFDSRSACDLLPAGLQWPPEAQSTRCRCRHWRLGACLVISTPPWSFDDTRRQVLAVGLLKNGFDVQVFERDMTAIRGEGKYRGPIQVLVDWVILAASYIHL